jgi:phosphoglycolate phosphatase-like HAD superfamily hydrolase
MHIGLDIRFRSFAKAWEERYLDRVHRSEIEFWEAMRHYLRSLGLADAQIDEVQAAGRAKRRDFERTSRPFPGIPATLAYLTRESVSLGVVCSRSLTQREAVDSLRALRIHHHFSVIITRLDAGDSNMLRTQLEISAARMGLKTSQVAYVGCHEVPLRTAMRCGMTTIAFNAADDVEVDHRLDHFDELPSLVSFAQPHLLAG